MIKPIKNFIKKYLVKKLVHNLAFATKENLLRLASLVEKIVPRQADKQLVRIVAQHFAKEHPCLVYAKKVLANLHPHCRSKFSVNFIVNHLLIANETRHKFREQEGFQPPSTILISPTMRCNLRCQGCYAAKYEREEDMELSTFDKIIREGKEIGTYFYTILGGEPFIYKGLFDILERHNDAYFQVYTNGTLLNEEMIERLADLGNAAPMFSLEGTEEQTDQRRAPGVYQKVMAAMDLCREKGVFFGYSSYVNRNNVQSVVSDEFIDLMVKKGAFVGWYFLCMPVGEDPSAETSFMPTPKQRLYLKERRDYIRKNKPIFIVDFWNDAPFVRGCIAARHFIHINTHGDIEPCIFIHFATDNIKETSLRQALKSAFFKAIKDRQPYDENLYLPCTIIDHPQILRQAVEETHPYPTHEGAVCVLTDSKVRAHLDNYSQEVKHLYDRVWKEDVANGRWARSREDTLRKKAGQVID